jgi:DNA-binding HxlR family transcriptional regulator
VVRTCSIARTLEVVGERWALLVVREVALGDRRFAGIQEATGAPPAVLSARLRSLVDVGVLKTRPYQEQGARTRTEYALTESGRALQPVLTALMDWGDQHLSGPAGPPAVTRHRECGEVVHARLVCDAGHEVAQPEIRAEPRTPAHSEPSTPARRRGRRLNTSTTRAMGR